MGLFYGRMMKTRILHTRFWQDEFVNNLNNKEKLLFIYLLTNDKVSLTGMYQLPDKYIKVDVEITNNELQKAKQKLAKAGKIYFYDGWIKIVNHDKYNSYTGEKIDEAKKKELALIPNKVIHYRYPIDTSIDTSSDTPNKDIDKDKHIDKDIDKDKDRFKEVWKKIYGKELQGSKTYVEAPIKRLIDGYGIKDVCGLLYWAEQNRKDNEYIAVIRHPKDLEEKWNSLINQYKKGNNGKRGYKI